MITDVEQRNDQDQMRSVSYMSPKSLCSAGKKTTTNMQETSVQRLELPTAPENLKISVTFT